LGVISRAKGKKYGKNLLLKTLEKAIEENIERVDLHTWSGNLKAMPLYKKIGMFWVPETSVYMQDYIPLLHQNDLTEEWFDVHPDWYRSQRRDLKQEPDGLTVEGMKIYRYRFEEGEDWMEVDIDRYGWGITGIKRKLDDEKITVKARVDSHNFHMGIENRYTLMIENGTSEEKELSLGVNKFEGLKFEDSFPSEVKIGEGETKKISREFLVSKKAKTYESNQKSSETIDTTIKIGDKEFELTTGGKVEPAVEVGSQRDMHQLFSDQKTDLYFDLKNNTEKRLSGKVEFNSDDSEGTIDFELEKKESSGFKMPVEPHFEDRKIDYIEFTPSVHKEDGPFLMESYSHPVVEDSFDLIALAKKEDEVFLVNDQIKVKAELEGGNIKVSELTRDSELPFEISQQIGPPFGRTPDSTLEYDHEFTEDEDEVVLTLKAESIYKPGALIKKHLKLKKRSNEVEFWSEIENVSDEDLECAAKTNTRKWDFQTEPYQAKARIYTPLKDHIVESDPVIDMLSSTMMPKDPDEWEETWTAYEDFGDSAVSGIIWDDENLEKVKMARGLLEELKSKTEKVDPREKFKTSHLWLSVKKPSLNSFRQTWNRLVGKREIKPNERSYGKHRRKHIEACLDENILEVGERHHRKITIDKAVDYPMPGQYTLKASDHMEISFTDGRRTKEVSKEKDEKELILPIDIDVKKELKTYLGTVNLHFSGERELDFELPLIITKDDKVVVEPEKKKGERVLRVDNGEIEFEVLDNFGGNLIGLKTSEGNTYLADSFPETKPKSWFENLVGGIEPRFMTPEDIYSFFETEKVSSEKVSEGRWKGVKADYEIQENDYLRAQRFSVKYLTLPGTKLIKIRITHDNPKDGEVNWLGEIFMDVSLNGELEETTVESPGKYENWSWSHQNQQFVTPANIEEPVFRFSDGDISLSGFALKNSPAFPSVICNKEIHMGILASNMICPPHQKEQIELGIALDIPEQDIDKARKAMKSKYK
ncbi:MAG: GNAT family N-acetyltransferase, partial [Candidatus Thermoplasmatota archaeon]|nr:GNAT family N-acetyltransferase [Candidatus Thermoplasmatota archaeon]